MRPERALLGVDDKSGLAQFASELAAYGVELIATGGTERFLRAEGLEVTSVTEVTGVEEMLGGRVKTLHPAVHAGILARRDHADDMRALEDHGFRPIDMVVVNLYPFAAAAAAGRPEAEAREAIDIGGPTLLRAAAKNWPGVAAVSSPSQYSEVAAALRSGEIGAELLRQLAAEVFQLTSWYDSLIADHLRRGEAERWPERLAIGGALVQPLRYGENPHQRGALYAAGPAAFGLAAAHLLSGGELSYTNWLDADSALRLAARLPQAAAVVVKHTNPCGVAVAPDAAEAFVRAYDCDPRSAYGGVVAVNSRLDLATAERLRSHFLELVVAPEVAPEAAEALASKPRLRVLEARAESSPAAWETRSVDGGFLVQERDSWSDSESDWQVASSRAPTPAEWRQLRLAWQVVAQVKSNAIVLCRDDMAVGIGAGQMSRVEAVQLAVGRAGDRAAGTCLASDAFFPMADGLEEAAASGVTAAIHPGGSKRDPEVVEAANRLGIALVATGRRHFRH